MILLSFTLKELYDPIYVRDSYAAINLLVFDGCLYFRAEDRAFFVSIRFSSSFPDSSLSRPLRVILLRDPSRERTSTRDGIARVTLRGCALRPRICVPSRSSALRGREKMPETRTHRSTTFDEREAN